MGQANDFHFKHLSVPDGLSNISVIAMEQDDQGQMWFGTRNGLNKYNGNEFVVYRNNPADSTSISDSDILSVLEDKTGDIWVGTYHGLNKYDPVKNVFKRYFQTEKPNSLCNNVIICSKEMPNGEIWFGTANGISIYSKIRDDFININYSEGNSSGLPYKNIQRIFLDSNNQVWVATASGFAKLIKREDTEFVFKHFKWEQSVQDLFIQDVIEIKPHLLGLATKYNGFVLFNTIEEKFIINEYPEISANSDIRVLKSASDGNIWLGTAHGVKIITPFNKVIDVKKNKVNSSGLSQNFIKSIFKDNNESIWLGTYSGGVNIWNEANENFVNLKNHNNNNNVVNTIIADGNSNLYFGTEGGDINIWNRKTKKLDGFKIEGDGEVPFYPVQTLLRTEPNLLWVGVLNYGLFVYDSQSKTIRKDIISKELKDYLSNTGVYVIKEDNNGGLWIGTFGKGLIKYNLKSKKYTVFGNAIGEEPYLSTNIIKTILVDSNEDIWAGGLGGLNKLQFNNDGTHKITNYFINDFTGSNIKTIYEDVNQTIWVGTNTKGLHKFNEGKFEKVIIDKVNPVTTILTILEDNQGILWISSDRGIIAYNPYDKTSIIYSQKDVANTYGFNPNSGIQIDDFYFYFGGLDGVTSFNSRKMVKNNYVPQVILSDLKIKNESVEIGDKNEILLKNISKTKEVVLDHNNSNFSIKYAMPNFINPESNHFAYRLKGLDDSWIYTKNTEAFYTIQNPGTYTFEVKGANGDEVWNADPTTLKIVVKAAPWKSWWALLIYGTLIILSLLALFWILKSKSELKHELNLESVEKERNKEIHNAKLEFFTNISHEFRTPLTLILGPLQQILAGYNGTNAMYKKLLVIESSANHLLQLINRLMDFRKLENNQSSLETAEGNVVKFLHEIFLSFTEYAKDGNYSYNFNSSDDQILLYYDRYKLERVFYNLISNAFRYTPKGGCISISISKSENNISIQVEDSGVGISEENIDKIFDRFFEVSIHNNPEKNYNKGTGIGLSIANNIVKLHKGIITVLNKDSGGVVFSVVLPLGRTHLSENEILKDFKMSDDVTQYVSQLETTEIQFEDDVSDLVSKEKKYTILLVEDNKSLRSFMKELLKKDYNILQAENGKIALKKAKKYLPDLIVSDVVMPEMVGTELCSAIKDNLKTSHIPVILLTSRTSLIYKFEGLESGADDYISKPFNLKEFKLRIKNLLESKQRLKDKFSNEDVFVPSEIAVTSLDEDLLKKAFKIVEDNLGNEDFDIPQFHSELGVSRSMLFTKIKAWTNFTPNEFIREIRLKSAAQLLEQNKINVAQVGYMVGFRRPKYFTKCFQKKYGLTPTQFVDKFIDEKDV
ncbi:two-component regulator propeller domain-containing protein [Formosa sp. PL04]|uniref:two-component regulator propeller domain-containing protein n=1 Tax=Formosa sp. PL04 TaxID=3081755 RepID=UPI00298112D2|nr:two-component regulator propeller domain-containing protein [Formosa sp. PL04]MDW5288116.1 two-component regulator propeller domain-containing protein [Formosa sp. PL04]